MYLCVCVACCCRAFIAINELVMPVVVASVASWKCGNARNALVKVRQLLESLTGHGHGQGQGQGGACWGS